MLVKAFSCHWHQRWVWPVLVAAFAWVLCPFWAQSHVPAFRDGYHFYYPQYHWLDQCYQRGEYFPKWNAAEGLGTSVAGQPTWQLYYPLRLVWLIPGFGLSQRFGLFVLVHFIVSVCGILRLARTLQVSVAASWLAALAFTLSCPVLFQHSNLIYLCSTAWIGWGLTPIVAWLVTSHPRRLRIQIVAMAGCLVSVAQFASLMLLAGDPQSAYHLILIALIASLLKMIVTFKSSDAAGDQHLSQSLVSASVSLTHPMTARGILNSICTAAILLLTCLQAYYACQWLDVSVRADAVISVTDSLNPHVASILAGSLPALQQDNYNFSLSPWSLPSLIWPTFGGHYQPDHSRWVDCIGSEGRMWIPSLYMGLMPFFLVLSWISTGRKPAQPAERFLAWMAAVALLAALGNYSPLWLLRDVLNMAGFSGWAAKLPHDSSFSLYGWMTGILPGYDHFRYPAKWFVWTSAGLSVVGACQLDRICHRNEDWLKSYLALRLTVVLSVVGLVMLLCVYFSGAQWHAWLQSQLDSSFDRMLGSAKLQPVVNNLWLSFLWPLVLLTAVTATVPGTAAERCVATIARRWGGWGTATASWTVSERWKWLVVGLTLAELSVCSRRWVATTPPVDLSNSASVHHTRLARWSNTARANINDFLNAETSSDMDAQLALQNTFLIGKLALRDGMAALHASGPLQPQALAKLCRWLTLHDDLSIDQPEVDAVLAELGIHQRLVRKDSSGFVWRDIPATRPLCEYIPTEALPTNQAFDTATPITWQWLDSSRLQVQVRQSQTGTLLIRQFNDGQWIIRCQTVELPVAIPNELFLQVALPAGQHELVLARQ
ncbi:MAG: hypothetical protein KF752_19705 [Pirellulaceae bacterium]|nr:hypothetical protein [Pirellulaceae bacterium]